MNIPRSTVAMWSNHDPRAVSIIRNTQLYSFGFAMAAALGGLPGNWTIRKLYIEFENVDEPEDAVSIPSVASGNSEHGTPYYTAMSGSTSRDFLRVDLLSQPTFSVHQDYGGYFSAGQGNILNLAAQTAGAVGFHGRTFSHSVNSKVCGSALVVAPVESDQTRDIVVARAYFSTPGQKLKVADSQVTVTWKVPFLIPE